VYALGAVRPVPRPPGTAREATEDDRPRLLDWDRAFGDEVLEEDAPGRLEPAKVLDSRLGAEHGGILLWEDGGQAMALAGWTGPTPNGIRVGPVSTPPELRGRGYATALTAELSHGCWTAAGGSASCSPTSRTRPRTRSTSASATSGSPNRR
jgi:predicted GNAT family acetyltransferase